MPQRLSLYYLILLYHKKAGIKYTDFLGDIIYLILYNIGTLFIIANTLLYVKYFDFFDIQFL